MGTMLEPPNRDFLTKIASLIQEAIDSWPRTLRLCMIIVAIAFVLAVWTG